MAAFTPEEIENQDFLTTMRGYDKEEVRAFLRAVAAEIEILLARGEVSPAPVTPVAEETIEETPEQTQLMSAEEANRRVEELLTSTGSAINDLQIALREEVDALRSGRAELEALRTQAEDALATFRKAAEQLERARNEPAVAEPAPADPSPAKAVTKEPANGTVRKRRPVKRIDVEIDPNNGTIVPATAAPAALQDDAIVIPEPETRPEVVTTTTAGPPEPAASAPSSKEPVKPPAHWEELLADPDLEA